MRRFVLEIDLNAVEPGQRHLDQMRIGRSRRIRLDLANRPVQPGAAVAIGFLTAIAQVWSRRSAVHVAMPPLSADPSRTQRSEEHTSELQSLMRISYAVFCLKKKKRKIDTQRD